MNVKSRKRREFLSGLQFEQLESRELLAGDLGAAIDVGEGEAGSAQIGYPLTSLGGADYLSGYSLGKTPMQVATEYLDDNAADFGLTVDDLNDYRVLSHFVSQHTRVNHIVLQQQHNGLDVLGAMINIAVDNDGRILAGGSSFVPGLSAETELEQSAVIGPVDALADTFSSLGLTPTSNLSILQQSNGLNQEVTISDGGIASVPIQGALGYVYRDGGLELVWVFGILTNSNQNAFTAFASAESGDFIYASDGVKSATYQAFSMPDMSPEDGSQQTVVNNPDAMSASPFGWHDTNGVPGAEFTDTRGNNAFVQSGGLGAIPPNSSGERADGGDELEFNFPYDPTKPATDPDNILASTTNAFVTMNIAHDVLANYGFDEAAGNFQATNYTGLGEDGDAILVDVADPDQICNAVEIAIPSPAPGASIDGVDIMLEMGYCNMTDPTRDSGLSNDILLHEFGHALIDRLVAGPNWIQGGYGPNQFGGVHEGGADYLALMFGMQATDTPEMAKWDTNWYMGDEDSGIRRQPYSYDMSVGGRTFEDYNAEDDPVTGNPNTTPHYSGEIVASMLYDMTWELIFKYGGSRDASAMDIAFEEDISRAVGRTNSAASLNFDIPTSMLGPDLLDLGTGANNLAMQLFVDGLKYSVPTIDGVQFTSLRDGILAADIALTGGVNHDALWRAFARRGLGEEADSGLLAATVPIETSYTLPTTPAHIAGTAFVDGNSDGVRDSFEAPLAGVNIYMDLNGNGTHERLEPWMTTDEEGNYSFELYVGGPFSIKALPMDNYLQTLPSTVQVEGMPVNDGGHDVYVVTGASADGVDFGFTVSDVNQGISGTKFNDLNANGTQDPGEIGIPDVYIYVDLDNDERIDIGEPATKTRYDGTYYLDYTEPGPVIVREVISPGYQQTSPANNAHEITVVAGLPYLGVDFGNHEVRDYGDLPDTFNLNDAPSHGLLDGFYLGASVDAEVGSIDGATASGDDTNNIDDEDGVAFVDALVRGNNDVTVEVTASTGVYGGGLLNAWIDFDGDGIFDIAEEAGDYSELIISNQVLVDGANLIDFSIPADAQLGATYARFRYSYEGNLGPNGAAIAGEVEDYRIDASFGGGILDDQPYANDDTFTATQGDIAVNLDVLRNDFGSSNGGPTLVFPAVNPIVTDQGGSASVNLATGRIFYTPDDGFTGTDTFDYEVTDGAGNFDSGTVTVHVQPRFVNPEAIDDYQVILDTTVGGETDIAVLENDIQGAFPPLSIVSWTDGNHGDVVLDGDNLTYVRTDSDPYTLDTFTYTVAGSAAGQPTSTATVTVQLGENVDTVEYIVEALSPLNGEPIQEVEEGDQFTIRVSVKDSRSTVTAADAGVYAAYVDMLYDADHLQVVPGSLDHGSIFTDIRRGNTTVPGLINETGGVQDGINQDETLFERGFDAMELFTVDVIAIASTEGFTLLETDPVDVTPLHDTVVIAPEPASVPVLQIDYNSLELLISPPAEGESLLDTNRDGAVTPIDALGIINQLNEFGSGAVAEGESTGLDRAFDVNRDSYVSPLDALAIINYLNDNIADTGEGESMVIVEQSTIDTGVVANDIAATEAVTADVVDEFLRVRENEIGLSMFTGGSQEVIEDDASDLESAIDDLADDVFGQWS